VRIPLRIPKPIKRIFRPVGKALHKAMPVLGHPVTRAVLALALVICIGLYYNADGTFFKWPTHRDTLRQLSVYGILACGMTLVIITGGIDLSVASVLALVAVSFSLMSIHWRYPAELAIPLSLAIGAGCGLASGTLASKFRIQPFIATLAMMVFARGLAKYVSDGRKISSIVEQPDGTYEPVELPSIFNQIDQSLFGDNISVVTLIFLACLVVSAFALYKLRWGRNLYAIGGNEEAARLSGIRVNINKTLAYVMSGLFAAVAGICQAAQATHGDPETASGKELDAIAMVVIGGTSLMGGKGGVLLTLLGAFTIGYLDKILSINAVPEAHRLMLTGGIIVAAVLAQRRKK
jgi:ribose transport system permease protein